MWNDLLKGTRRQNNCCGFEEIQTLFLYNFNCNVATDKKKYINLL